MAATDTDLFRSLIGDAFKKTKITACVYPGNGVLYPRFESTTYYRTDKASGKKIAVVSNADLTVVAG